MENYTNNFKTKAEAVFQYVESKLAEIRAGGANPAILQNVTFDYYDTPTLISSMASISSPDATMLLVTPYDQSVTKDMTAAIQAADLDLSPIDEGDKVRIPIAPLTSEKRQFFVKKAKEVLEEGKIRIRNIRQDINKQIDKADDQSEDSSKQQKTQIQTEVDSANKKMETMLSTKIDQLTNL
ncbi:MAG: ribosome recycling factor [Tenericutes bacterium]|nr:MAG: ribosome recycling factor [Mycoplasmatota bacterium]